MKAYKNTSGLVTLNIEVIKERHAEGVLWKNLKKKSKSTSFVIHPAEVQLQYKVT